MSLFGAQDLASVIRGRGSYANPHATIALRDIPTNIKQVFRLCRYYLATDCLLGALVDKMAEYPITNLVIQAREDGDLDTRIRQRWDKLLDTTLDLRAVMRQINVDLYCFGNAFRYLHLPFVRYFECKTCANVAPMRGIRGARVTFHDRKGKAAFLTGEGFCPRCNAKRSFAVKDRKSEARTGLAFTRLSPLNMSLEYCQSSDARAWYWVPPHNLQNAFRDQVRVVTESTELSIITAIMRQQPLEMNPARLWVSQSDSIPGVWDGWGFPPLFRVLEDVYYYKILRRANEALAQEHVVPMRVYSPAVAGDATPQRSLNLSSWVGAIKSELQRFKFDPNHQIVMPVPVNVQQVGGQARVLMVAAEMEAAARNIATGVGCPLELVWGGLNWTGASVSLRVLENHFLNSRKSNERLLDFIVPKLSSHFRLPLVNVRLSDFKMADDVQQQANDVNLMLQGFLSREGVLPEMGYDPAEEFDRLEREHERLNLITLRDALASANMNNTVQLLTAKAAVLQQYELQLLHEQMQSLQERKRLGDVTSFVQKLHQKGMTSPVELDQSAMILMSMPPQYSQTIMTQWSQTMPLVSRLLQLQIANTQQMMAAQMAPAVDPATGQPVPPGPGQVTSDPSAVDGGAVDPGAAQPEQRPPRGTEGGI